MRKRQRSSLDLLFKCPSLLTYDVYFVEDREVGFVVSFDESGDHGRRSGFLLPELVAGKGQDLEAVTWKKGKSQRSERKSYTTAYLRCQLRICGHTVINRSIRLLRTRSSVLPFFFKFEVPLTSVYRMFFNCFS